MKARIDFPGAPGDAGPRLERVFDTPVAKFVAYSPAQVPAVLEAAQREAGAGRWVLGWAAYEAAPAFDAALRVQASSGSLPLAVFAAYAAPSAHPPAAAGEDAAFACGPWQADTSPTRAHAAIDDLRRRIGAGDFYQVNLTTRLRAACRGSGEGLFAALRATQPAGFCLHLQDQDWEILSVSPELFFDWHTDGTLRTRPMKGTAPRHGDARADAAAARALQDSAKERAENLMIVDLLRNDLGRIARLGTVQVPELFQVEALPTAWQMSSTVQCRTRPDIGLAEVFAALFPCGSVTGAPKVAAMQAIAALEDSPRRVYCGALGVIRPGGHATFSVGIRTVLLDHVAGCAECGVGSGIVFDSSGPDEYAEWLVKRRFLLRATGDFQLLTTLALRDGHYDLLPRHLARLAGSGAHFGYTHDPEAVTATLARVAAGHPAGTWRVRLLVDRQGCVASECHPLETLAEPVTVVLASRPMDGDPEFLRHKTTRRQAYAPFAPAPGVFDTLLWNARGELTEFTRGNLLLDMDGELVTPPQGAGLLPGVMRAELLARGEIREASLTLEDLSRARALWFINSVRGRLRVTLV